MPDEPFDPGPPRDRIHADDMPPADELPEILEYLRQAGVAATPIPEATDG